MNEQKPATIARVATAADLLKAGFTPQGGDLKHNVTGATVSQAVLNGLAGRVITVEETGVADFPAIHGTTILPKEAVALVARRTKVKTYGNAEREVTLFTDGSAMLSDGAILSPRDAALMAGGLAPELPKAK